MMVNFEPAEFYRLNDEEESCPFCAIRGCEGECQDDDEEWWENAESEVAALDREERE